MKSRIKRWLRRDVGAVESGLLLAVIEFVLIVLIFAKVFGLIS